MTGSYVFDPAKFNVTTSPRVKLTVTTWIHINDLTTVKCSCGRSISGDRGLVEEAHRQHVTNHGSRSSLT